jgi:hypothetical protein
VANHLFFPQPSSTVTTSVVTNAGAPTTVT